MMSLQAWRLQQGIEVLIKTKGWDALLDEKGKLRLSLGYQIRLQSRNRRRLHKEQSIFFGLPRKSNSSKNSGEIRVVWNCPNLPDHQQVVKTLHTSHQYSHGNGLLTLKFLRIWVELQNSVSDCLPTWRWWRTSTPCRIWLLQLPMTLRFSGISW